MAKTLTESAVTTRNARSKLAEGIHWRRIDPTIHLGYRKTKRGGRWLVRWRDGEGYRQAPLGVADDVVAQGNLSFEAAESAARVHVEIKRKGADSVQSEIPLTVGDVVATYVMARDVRESKRAGRSVRSDAGQRLRRYVLGQPARGRQPAIAPATISHTSMTQLDEGVLRGWVAGLPPSLKDATIRRLTNDFKAALNAGYEEHYRLLPATLASTIKRGLISQADDEASAHAARENQILTDAEVARLIRASKEVDEAQGWEGDLFRLVIVLAATGARFSQCANIRVADCQLEASRILVPSSRKGRGGKAFSRPVPIGPDVVENLRPALAGRDGNALLLERWRKRQNDNGAWEKANRAAWGPSELARPWREIRVRSCMPAVIPYALRHSSIVRGLRANLPIRLVAALHDTSVTMIERHYGRHIADGLEDLAAKAVVPLIDMRN